MSFGAILLMMLMAYIQNASFSIVSRSRNRDNITYHLIAAMFSNLTWFVTMKFLIIDKNMSWGLFVPYCVGTVAGSVTGQKVSMFIEKLLGATSDSHLAVKK